MSVLFNHLRGSSIIQKAVELSQHHVSFSSVWCFSDKISSFLEYFGAWIAGEEQVRGVHNNSQGIFDRIWVIQRGH